jgi:cell wall-associated NlpC family hydrolase
MSRAELGGAALAAAVTLALSACGAGGPHATAPPRTTAARHVHVHARSHPATGPTAVVAEVPDPLAGQSYPEPAAAAAGHPRAAAPRVAAARAARRNGAPSLSEAEAQLREEQRLERQLARHSTASLVEGSSGAFTPRNVVPTRITQVIAGGNAIADFPYVYGGGHASFIDRAYDCSGSVSYALAAGGLIGAPETSGQLESWGAPGPGHWLTVFANAGHTFMIIDGVWFDTAGRAGPYSTRWLTSKPSLVGYAVRHYPGL